MGQKGCHRHGSWERLKVPVARRQLPEEAALQPAQRVRQTRTHCQTQLHATAHSSRRQQCKPHVRVRASRLCVWR
eukprot:6699757-Prymnesium_polylepis.1